MRLFIEKQFCLGKELNRRAKPALHFFRPPGDCVYLSIRFGIYGKVLVRLAIASHFNNYTRRFVIGSHILLYQKYKGIVRTRGLLYRVSLFVLFRLHLYRRKLLLQLEE